MTLSDATTAYQSLLEGHRTLTEQDDHGLREDVRHELQTARAAMEVAWLNHVATNG